MKGHSNNIHLKSKFSVQLDISTMAPLIDLEWLTAVVEETGLEYMTRGMEIKQAWEKIAERFCEERGIELIDYKLFSRRWKNAKFYIRRSYQKGQYLKDADIIKRVVDLAPSELNEE